MLESINLTLGNELIEFVPIATFLVIDLRTQPFHVIQQGIVNWLASEFPNYGSQLWTAVKGDTVINPPHMPLTIDETMPAFAVSVVDEDVKHPHMPHLRHLIFIERKVIQFRVMFDKELH